MARFSVSLLKNASLRFSEITRGCLPFSFPMGAAGLREDRREMGQNDASHRDHCALSARNKGRRRKKTSPWLSDERASASSQGRGALAPAHCVSSALKRERERSRACLPMGERNAERRSPNRERVSMRVERARGRESKWRTKYLSRFSLTSSSTSADVEKKQKQEKTRFRQDATDHDLSSRCHGETRRVP